jgi:hypothetical protein
MSQKIFSSRQQNITSWILLVTMVLLAGVALYLRQNPAPDPSIVPTQVATTSEQEPAQSAAVPDSWLGDVILAVQVAIFTGALGYFIGYTRGRRREAEKQQRNQPKSQGDTPNL